jgi:Zn-dependent peptidase ImmA (M78 family)
MPRELVEEEVRKRLAKGKTPTPESIVSELAQLFRVSDQAMEYRLVNLGFLLPG